MRKLGVLVVVLVACAIPFTYTVDVLDYLEREGTFRVGAGGIDPNPRTVGPVEVSWNPDPRVTLSGATLTFRVCFSSETAEASFSGSLDYAAYLGPEAPGLFAPANLVAQGSRDVSQLNAGPVCVNGQASLTQVQLDAVRSGRFYVGARISGSATSTREAIIRYRAEVFRIQVSGTVRP